MSPERQHHYWSKMEKTHIVAGLLSNSFSAFIFRCLFLPSAPFKFLFSFSSDMHNVLDLTCSWVTGMSRCLDSSRRVLTSVLMSSLQPTSTTLALGQNSCVSPCHWRTNKEMQKHSTCYTQLKRNECCPDRRYLLLRCNSWIQILAKVLGHH